MNTKLFLSTFLLIFLAELGDKTQLAAMARAATGGDAKWTVFVAASSALVASTLIAVLLGSVLNRFVPQAFVKVAAGILFVVFGCLILGSAFLPRKVPAVEAAAPAGIMTDVVFRIAAGFERAAVEDYAKLAASASEPAVRSLMVWLAAEEERHAREIRRAADGHAPERIDDALAAQLPGSPELSHDVAAGTRPMVEHAIEHEEATARFYAELARSSVLPALRAKFAALAQEERDHARRLAEALAPRVADR